MANCKSAEKRIRRNARRAIINRDRRSGMRTQIKKVRLAIEAGDSALAEKEYAALQPVIMRSVAKNILHKNTSSRLLSRLSGHIKSLKQAA